MTIRYARTDLIDLIRCPGTHFAAPLAMRWLLFTILATAAVGAMAVLRRRGTQTRPEVGAVSDDWIAQHRGIDL